MSYSEKPKYDDGSKFKKYLGVVLVLVILAVGVYVVTKYNLLSSHPTEQAGG